MAPTGAALACNVQPLAAPKANASHGTHGCRASLYNVLPLAAPQGETPQVRSSLTSPKHKLARNCGKESLEDINEKSHWKAFLTDNYAEHILYVRNSPDILGTHHLSALNKSIILMSKMSQYTWTYTMPSCILFHMYYPKLYFNS